MFKMICYTVKKKDAYGYAIFQKSPFTPPKEEKKSKLSKHSEKKILFQNIKNWTKVAKDTIENIGKQKRCV